MKRLTLALTVLLASCNSTGISNPNSFQTALTHDLSFTPYAVTTHLILKNDGGCDELSGGWVDSANINNLLFLGDPQYQKWAKPGQHVMDGVGMALFWTRSVRFVFACKKNGQLSYHQTEPGMLNESRIRQNRENLVLGSKLEGGEVQFTFNYPFL